MRKLIFVCLTAITDMLPLILNQLGAENLNSLKKIATAVSGGNIIVVPNFVRFFVLFSMQM
jgi:hypothetical protein